MILVPALMVPVSVYSDEELFQLDIPAQAAVDSLDLLAEKTQSSLFTPTSELSDVRTNALLGSYSLSDALQYLLKGTRLNAVVTDNDVIAISIAPVIDEQQLTNEENDMQNMNRVSAGILGGLFGLFGLEVLAQPADQEESTSRYAIEEIIVSSRRVEEGLQNAPLAITALSGQELENRGALDVSDFAAAAPNVSLKSSGAISGFSAAPRTSIRGIGQSDFVINTDPAVGIYADGVYLGRSLGSILDLLDVERVEALRGPQGTLFGRNSTGGAINVIAVKPSVEDGLEGYVSLAAGEGGYKVLRASANVPLTDTVAARVSAFNRQRDGFVPALNYTNLDLGAEDVTGARVAIRWEPTDDITLDFSADVSSRDDSPAPMYAAMLGDLSANETGLNPVAAMGAALPGESTSIFGRIYNREQNLPGVDLIDSYRTTNLLCGTSDQAYRDATPSCYGNSLASSRDGAYNAWWDQEGNMIRPEQTFESYGYAINAEWALEGVTLSSISSWRGFDASFINGSPTALLITANNNEVFEQDQFSQEFQINGTAFDGMVDWIGGIYYMDEEGYERVKVIAPYAPPAFLNPPPGPNQQNDLDFLPINNIQNRYVENTSKAIFGQAIYHINDTLDLTVGLRKTEDEKAAEFVLFNNNFVDATNFENTLTVEETNFLVNLSWQMNNDTMFYGQVSDGFRDGGFPSRIAAGETELQLYDPEFVQSMELGVKSTLLDGRLRLNGALFQMNYSEMQVTATQVSPTPGAIAPAVDNLGDSTLSGFELEANYVVNDNFRLDSSIGYLQNSIDSLVSGGLVLGGGTNLRKEVDTSFDLPFAPEWQVNLGANYSIFIDGGAEVRTRIDYIYEAEQYNTIANYDQGLLPATTKINANASYIPADANWQITIGARNLTDEEDIAVASLNSGLGNGIYHVAERGREAYLEFKYSFGE